ncbi:polysaccharide biosynthesis/export family protein [Flavobacteriales bacterium]|nr:polysaccharide biosynthesis/export family protein [Flavobacteriales bacterium]
MIKLRSILIFGVFCVLMSSCATKESIVLFQDDEQKDAQNTSENVSYLYEKGTIQKNDILKVSVSALDMMSVAAFVTDNIQSRTPEQFLLDGFKVNENGKINLPLVGEVEVLGLTLNQASVFIQRELSKSIIDPIVNLNFLNFRFTILGEVNNPGTFTVYNPKINLIQALGLAGDITMTGKRDNIKLIREVDGVTTKTTIDLTNSDFMSSEAYYLEKDDIIYVEPTFTKITNSGYIGPLGSIATFVSLLLSVIVYSQTP